MFLGPNFDGLHPIVAQHAGRGRCQVRTPAVPVLARAVLGSTDTPAPIAFGVPAARLPLLDLVGLEHASVRATINHWRPSTQIAETDPGHGPDRCSAVSNPVVTGADVPTETQGYSAVCRVAAFAEYRARADLSAHTVNAGRYPCTV
jgi:hypothetical protein